MANDFKRMQKLAGIITESKLNENKPYALLATVADDWGKDSDIYGDLEAAVVGWTDRNGELSPKGKIAIKNLLSNWDLLDDYGFFIDNDEMNEANKTTDITIPASLVSRYVNMKSFFGDEAKNPALKAKLISIITDFFPKNLDVSYKELINKFGKTTADQVVSLLFGAYMDGSLEYLKEPINRLYDERDAVDPRSIESDDDKIEAMLKAVADDWGKDSDLYDELGDAIIGYQDRHGELTPKGKIAIKALLSNYDALDDYGHFLDENVNEGDTDYDRAKDAKRLGVKGEKDIYGAGVEKGEEIEKKKMKMSELKAAIKELALSEGEDDVNFNDDESLYDPVYEGIWSVLPARIPEFIQKIKDIKDEYHAVVGSDDVYDGLDHAISAAEKLMNSELSEAKKDEEVEDIKDVDVTVGDEETTADVTTVDVDPNVKAVQDSLTQAQAAAEKLGDEKLTDQIGNTITFFTRTHVVEKPGMTAESNIKERINKLIKSL